MDLHQISHESSQYPCISAICYEHNVTKNSKKFTKHANIDFFNTNKGQQDIWHAYMMLTTDYPNL